MKLKPSEYFHRNMACTFMDDEVGLQLRHLVGHREHPLVHRLPPPGHHLAELAGVVERQFAGIPDDERQLICAGNAARLYDL